ncbi:uncharacterized protein LOC115624502 [Scaptodrosophila lebanonensis]|uniref:Uncharacterized protein LOC115624502 n=1 Tax=Drosophila lebanonensis TaxID=7225 RepID=A0A6J2TE64_DROLE|nr:uncharacterized protein LOC115624502 [Scaptodrosophila lebanonensis]
MLKVFGILLVTFLCTFTNVSSGQCPKFNKSSTLAGKLRVVAYSPHNEKKDNTLYCLSEEFPPKRPGGSSLIGQIVDSDNSNYIVYANCLDLNSFYMITTKTYSKKNSLTAEELQQVKDIHKKNGFKKPIFTCW